MGDNAFSLIFVGLKAAAVLRTKRGQRRVSLLVRDGGWGEKRDQDMKL